LILADSGVFGYVYWAWRRAREFLPTISWIFCATAR
jgi:hypothetical protein